MLRERGTERVHSTADASSSWNLLHCLIVTALTLSVFFLPCSSSRYLSSPKGKHRGGVQEDNRMATRAFDKNGGEELATLAILKHQQ